MMHGDSSSSGYGKAKGPRARTSSIDVPEHETAWAEFFKPNILWIMLMMYLGYAQWMLQRANQKSRRLRNAPLGDAVSQKRCVNNNEQQRAYPMEDEVGSHCAKQGLFPSLLSE